MENKELLQLCDSLGVLKQLEARGYIERKGEEVIFKEKAIKLLKKEQKASISSHIDGVEGWIDEYRSLFPKGVVSGGIPVRGDKQACIKKMKTFLTTYKEYDKDLILRATENYILSKEVDGYKYLQCAHYFISKDKTSNLAAQCQFILEQDINSEKSNTWEEEM